MAYADQKPSGNRIVALIVVAVLHVVLAYGLVTGLAFEAVKQVAKRVTTIDIEEEKKVEEPPPPPPEVKAPPPPVVAPPPKITLAPPPKIEVAPKPPPPPPPVLAPPAPPPPPPPKFKPAPPTPRGNPGNWATPDDYPTRAAREGAEGVTRVSLTVGPDGRVQGCQVTSSSGNAELDSTTCKLLTRRGRFKASTDENGQDTTGTWTTSIRWVIPK